MKYLLMLTALLVFTIPSFGQFKSVGTIDGVTFSVNTQTPVRRNSKVWFGVKAEGKDAIVYSYVIGECKEFLYLFLVHEGTDKGVDFIALDDTMQPEKADEGKPMYKAIQTVCEITNNSLLKSKKNDSLR